MHGCASPLQLELEILYKKLTWRSYSRSCSHMVHFFTWLLNDQDNQGRREHLIPFTLFLRQLLKWGMLIMNHIHFFIIPTEHVVNILLRFLPKRILPPPPLSKRRWIIQIQDKTKITFTKSHAFQSGFLHSTSFKSIFFLTLHNRSKCTSKRSFRHQWLSLEEK
jgi:hypothetical protein